MQRVWKSCNFPVISRYRPISEMTEDRWVYVACFTSNWTLFPFMWHYRDCPRGVLRETKIWRKRPFSELGVELLGNGWRYRGRLYGIYAVRRSTSIESLVSHSCDIYGIVPGAYSGNHKAAIFAPVRLSHAGIAETGQRKYPPFLSIRLFPLLLFNNIASGGLSATVSSFLLNVF